MKRALLIATAVCALAGAGFAVAALTALKTVNIRSTGFVPKTVTVAGGDTVRWKNVDTVRHQVVANNGAFASGQLPPGGIYSKLLNAPGTYPYHDALHPTLKGTVKVTGNPPSVSIGASVPITVFGSQIHVGGTIAPPAVGDTVSVYAQPSGQLSFVKLADVQTTTNGAWDFVVSPEVLTAYKATWKGKTSAIVTVRQKRICARLACAIEIAFGRYQSTVMPPRIPWRMTAPSARYPSRRTHRRGSARPSQIASTTIRNPTVLAIRRCACS